MRVSLVWLVLVVAALTGADRVAAQPATPAAGLDIPAPGECQVPARNTMELLALAGGADVSTPATIPTPTHRDALPMGPPPDPADAVAVERTVRELVACANARDPFRAVALVSDRYLDELAALVAGALAGGANELAAVLPVPLDLPADQQLAYTPPVDLRLLPDGRIGGIVQPVLVGTSLPDIGVFVLFAREGDRWLIDGVLPIELVADSATPVS